ncbi:hypothetical protein EVAR_57764_1 [Eumeta japonica]|uniref:Uncharacterized protein n=1 Tax=Eumeta variegata TaxID=151549 RepID=A0A4C1Y906_EUMVA|nr:hypothetical protein EVAR_57764_1 [Eumeta japonica]
MIILDEMINSVFYVWNRSHWESLEVVYLNKACPDLSRGTRARAPGDLELLSVPEDTCIAREFLLRLVPGSPIVSGEDKFPYQEIGTSRLNCGDNVGHP